MLDLVGALFAGAYLATLVIILVWNSSRSLASRAIAVAALAVWLGVVLTVAGGGVLVPGTLGPFPPGLVPFAVLLVSLLTPWAYHRRIREALSRLDLSCLVGLHGFRVGGVFFIVLDLSHRLAPAFAMTAGIGDIAVGTAALVVSARLAAGHAISRRAIRLWNTLGALDLVLALTVGMLSIPGSPVGIFGVEPGMRTMTTVPWILVPGAIVPLLLLTHLVIHRATSNERTAGAHGVIARAVAR
jgi:hypothetical protein